MPRRNLSLLLPPSLTGQSVGVDPMISGVTADSRNVINDMLFAALPGSKVDGREYITQAISMGATAILAPAGTPHQGDAQNVAFLTSDNVRLAFTEIAAAFYSVQPRTLAAVTGTNGKTTTAQFTRDLWAQTGYRAASIGTLGLVAPHLTRPGSLTTPDTVSLYRDFAMLVENGVSHCVFEASSHGLDQYRLHAAKLKVAGFTNLTRDHLDYHETMENYRAAKLKLFTEVLPQHATAVINADIPDYPWLFSDIVAAKREVISYGHAGSDLSILDIRRMGQGERITLQAMGSEYVVDLPFIGHYQVENALCAAGMVIASGEAVSTTLANLANLAPVRGRMELVGTTSSGAAVYVDYAHTPDGLENILRALRPHTVGKLHVVFGCGGDRDAGKRPIMGKIANDLADVVTITDDNPRTENADLIRAAIKAAAPTAAVIANRADAIQEAISALRMGDVLVIAGKGHEQGQIIGTDVLPFDDAEVARFALNLNKKAGLA